ncbi:MAG: GyrI-like domain-containing protein [Deltaproteobacteria bacterium]|nr:GyrI-like domain-containing protein [Deltaproteobacteria bacterium]
MKNQKPEIKDLKERQVAFVSFTGNYIGKPEIFQELFNKLCGWAGPKGALTPKTVFLSSYQDDPKTTPPDKLSLDLCMGIPDDMQTEGDIQKKVLPGGKYVVMHSELTGPQEYSQAWEAIVEWMIQNRCEIDMTRPSYEIYLNNPEEHPKKHHMIDICMSVKPESSE